MKNKVNLNSLPTHEELHQKWMQDPEYAQLYNQPDPWFEVAKVLLEIRVRSGMTQKKLAQELNTSQSAISRLESGEYNPTLKFLDKVAKVFGKKLKIEFV